MRIIEIASQDNGAHSNQNSNSINTIPDGWAVIPDGLETENFPFGDVIVEEIDGVMTVTEWTPLPMPEIEPIEEQHTQLDIIEAQVTYTAMMTDTLLEV